MKAVILISVLLVGCASAPEKTQRLVSQAEPVIDGRVDACGRFTDERQWQDCQMRALKEDVNKFLAGNHQCKPWSSERQQQFCRTRDTGRLY